LPWDESQVAYVWADALVNYLSALTYARPGTDLVPEFWPAVRHLLGKDILRFHCVYWPAMLLSAGYEVPQQLFVHGYLLLDDRKISKSQGNVIDPLELIDIYGADAVRFWCARAVSFGQDGSASLDDIRERYERELGNDLGNLLSRTTAMIARYRDGALAKTPGAGAIDAEGLRDALVERLDRFDLTGALEEIWQAVRRLNQHVEASAPWELAKDDAKAGELDAVLYDLADGLCAVAVAVSPYLPETAPRILEALGQPAELALERVRAQTAEAAEGIAPAPPLFPRVEEPTPA
jgi:methionyl-tRNA synthetase